MWNWLRRLFCREKEAPADEMPAWAVEMLEELREPQRPPWVAELTEGIQRSVRAQGKYGLLIEELDHKLEGGLIEIKQALAARPAEARGPRWDDLLDAMDLLDEARRTLQQDHPSAAQGLSGVQDRLSRHLSQGGLVRHAPTHEPLNGALFRVVGTEARDDLPEGAITRVVRAAVRRGSDVVREGEVITNRRSLP